jgi:flavin-dependent dehydrogenase
LKKIDIIGGSISGLSTAISIKEQNKSIDVIVHEKHKKIGYNHEGRRCGEAHIMLEELKKWRPDKSSIYNMIKKMEIYIGKKKYEFYYKPWHICILNRQEYIHKLEIKARKLGVKIQTNDKIKSVNNLDGDIIVDASGCPSFIKRELSIDKGIKGFTYQQTLENSNFFNKDLMRIIYYDAFGYYWIFPRNPEKKEINLGLGFVGNKKPDFILKEKLEKFKKKMGITGKINYKIGGLIPSGLQKPFLYRNILFVGDAGVGTFPLTGEGIFRALLSGELAGTCIANNNIKKYPFYVKRYFIKWNIIGNNIRRINSVLREINYDLVLKSTNFFSRLYLK